MHSDPTQTAITLLLFSLVMTACGAPAEVAEIEQRRLWSHTFADPPMVLELTDAGWIHAVTHPEGDVELPGTRYLLHSDGSTVWEGACATRLLIDPEGGHIFQAHHQFGLGCSTENQIEAFRFDVR